MFDLSKIYVGGSFYFSSGDNLKTKCKEAKVPNDCCGVYIVYACCEDEESIVYIEFWTYEGWQTGTSSGWFGKKNLRKTTEDFKRYIVA